MNRKEIIELIKDPSSLKDEQAANIKELAAKFPYSGIAQALYAKTLHVNDDILYSDQLKTAAIVCSDRNQLYKLIHQTKLRKLIEEIEEEVSLDITEELILEESSTKKEEVNIEPEQQETIEVVQEEKKDIDPLLDELEQNIIAQAINSSIQLEVPNSSTKEEEKEESESSTAETEEEIPSEESTKTKFSNWFDAPSKEKKPTPPKKKDLSAMIDSFLNKKNTQEDKPEFFSPSNVAKISLVDDEEFVTETLANVYASQGNFEKAIRIYERLSLINPEKNTFFASRIRFLKEKLDNKTE